LHNTHQNYGNQQNNSNQQNYGNHQNAGKNYNEERIVNAENLNIDTTLNDISRELKPGETLVLDIGNNYFNQTDEIYDTLVMKGYDVKKSFRNGRNQIIVSRNAWRP
jgi:predicted acyl esterase